MSTHHDRPHRRVRATARAGLASALLAGVTAALVAVPASSQAAADPLTAPPYTASPYLVAETAPGAASGVDDHDSSLAFGAVLGGRVIYTGNDGQHGNEVWSTDGTRAGTRMVADLAAGTEGSYPRSFVVMGERVYFTATVGGSEELWTTDGTRGGTHMVRDLAGATSAAPTHLTVSGKRLFMVASVTTDEGASLGRELVVSDGTAAGTRLAADVKTGSGGPEISRIVSLGGGRVGFFAAKQLGNTELWTSDGTPQGTTLARDLNGTAAPSVLEELVSLPDGTMVLPGNDGSGWRLWRSDGTSAGTIPVDPDVLAPAGPSQLTVLGDEVFFRASTIGAGAELFRTDGTAAGTGVVADLVPGPQSSSVGTVGVAAGEVWFQASTADGRQELWSHRPGGATRMRAVLADGGASAAVVGFAGVNGRMVFGASIEGGPGSELSTVEGDQVRVLGNLDGAAASYPTLPVALRGTALYTATSEGHGREVFAWNTQPTSTRLRAAKRWSARAVARRAVRVRVEVRGGALAQSGPVVVREGRRVVGKGRVLRGSGTVRITKRLTPGPHRLVAVHLGSTAGRASASKAVRVVVARPR